jgi:CRP-like cAMP-binding protein
VRLGEGAAEDGLRARRLALKRDVLMKMPLFARLDERELLRVMQVAEVSAYKPGETVVREGDRGDELFIMLSGRVRVSRGEAVLTEFGQGEHFGEMALLRSMPRSATVTAVEDSELISVRRADFFAILRKEHELAVKLLWQFLGVLADRLEKTSRDLSTAREELAAEDITDAIFPEVDDEARSDRVRDEGGPLDGRRSIEVELPSFDEPGAGAAAGARDGAPEGALATSPPDSPEDAGESGGSGGSGGAGRADQTDRVP